jgi:hypothetical protein
MNYEQDEEPQPGALARSLDRWLSGAGEGKVIRHPPRLNQQHDLYHARLNHKVKPVESIRDQLGAQYFEEVPPTPEDLPRFTIGYALKVSGRKRVQTIRDWERKGFIPPPKRNAAGQRRYTQKDIDRIIKVAAEMRFGRLPKSMTDYTTKLIDYTK